MPRPRPASRVLLKDRSIFAMFAGYSCILAVFYGLLTWMPSYLHKATAWTSRPWAGDLPDLHVRFHRRAGRRLDR
jgi:hypothetical protein